MINFGFNHQRRDIFVRGCIQLCIFITSTFWRIDFLRIFFIRLGIKFDKRFRIDNSWRDVPAWNTPTIRDNIANLLNKVWSESWMQATFRIAETLNLEQTWMTMFLSIHPPDFRSLMKFWNTGTDFVRRWLITANDNVIPDSATSRYARKICLIPIPASICPSSSKMRQQKRQSHNFWNLWRTNRSFWFYGYRTTWS